MIMNRFRLLSLLNSSSQPGPMAIIASGKTARAGAEPQVDFSRRETGSTPSSATSRLRTRQVPEVAAGPPPNVISACALLYAWPIVRSS